MRGLVLGDEDGTDKALQRVSSGLSDGTVVHLVVRHTAKVKYSVQGSNFELSISASDTAETFKRFVAITLMTAHPNYSLSTKPWLPLTRQRCRVFCCFQHGEICIAMFSRGAMACVT